MWATSEFQTRKEDSRWLIRLVSRQLPDACDRYPRGPAAAGSLVPIRSIVSRSLPLGSTATRRGFTGHVAHPIRSIRPENEPVSGPLLRYEV